MVSRFLNTVPLGWSWLVIATLATAPLFLSAQTVQLTPPPQPIPSTYFGMHVHEPLTPVRLPTIPIHTLRLWDTSVNWPDVETARGVYNWTRLDAIVTLAQQNNWQIVMPIGYTPTWASARPTENLFNDPTRLGWSAEPRNLQDWRDYVQALATRYQGRIHYWEIWNEPNNKIFFSGTMSAFVPIVQNAYQVLKQVDATNVILSPAAADNGGDGVTWLTQFLQAGGGGYNDVIAYHFYVGANPPEILPSRAKAVQTVMQQYGQAAKPLWNTEATWAISDIGFPVASDGTGFMARAYILNWASGIRLFDWYAWDDRMYPSVYMVQNDLHTLTATARAYAELEKWLIGARMYSCTADAGSNWVCGLERADGTGAYIVWNPSTTLTLPTPAAWQAKDVRDLTGAVTPSSASFQAGPLPVLIESDAPLVPINTQTHATSAASYLTGPVAPDSIISVFGSGLTTATAAAPWLPLLETLAGAVATIKDSTGAQQFCLFFYASPGQVNLLLPAGLAAGPATLTLTRNDGVNTAVALTIALVAPGLFTANANGQGAPAGFATTAVFGNSLSTQSLAQCDANGSNCRPNPVDLGAASAQTVLVLYGTGLRHVSSLNNVSATLCGTSLPVLYAGAQGNYAGLDQVNLFLPQSVRGCGAGTLVLTVDGQIANPVSITIP